MSQLTIIGIGSPFSDDRVGWSVAEMLSTSKLIAAYGERVRVTGCRSPASEFLSLLTNTAMAIVVDAMLFSGAPGTVYRLGNIRSTLSNKNFLSSHGLDLRSMLELADTLKQSPNVIIVYGIEAGAKFQLGATMRRSVYRAIARVADDIKRDVVDYCGSPLTRNS